MSEALQQMADQGKVEVVVEGQADGVIELLRLRFERLAGLQHDVDDTLGDEL